MRIETSATDRKAMAKAVADYLGETLHYMGPPTFAYAAGQVIIHRDGTITSETYEGEAELRAFLEQNGFAMPLTDELNITLPTTDMTVMHLKNLVFMLHAKQYLLNRAVGAPCFAVSAELVNALETLPPDTTEAFLALVAQNGEGCRGFAFDSESVTLTFARSEDPDCNKAYAQLASAMMTKAKEASRIKSDEQKPENEKYYFRSWIIQLGFGGADFKTTRKVLLQNLKGYSAFRTDEDADKFKVRMKAKRKAAKAQADTLRPEPIDPSRAIVLPDGADPALAEAVLDELLIQQVNSMDEASE